MNNIILKVIFILVILFSTAGTVSAKWNEPYFAGL